MPGMGKSRCIVLVGIVSLFLIDGAAIAQRQSPRFVTDDPACVAPTLVSTGGAGPRSTSTLAIRWTGFSNFELAYKGTVLLLDAYFDRGAVFPSLGFAATDVKRVDAVLIGHGHFDHMSDAAVVALGSGATVVGAANVAAKLAEQAVPAAQIRTVHGQGGETMRFGPFTVEPVLGRHTAAPLDVMNAFQGALDAVMVKRSPQEVAEQAAIRARGVSSPTPDAIDGTLTYLITLDTGFRLIYRDSAGAITEQERATMARVREVDVALVAMSPGYVTEVVASRALEYAHLFKPSVFIPAHHDAARDGLWRPTEPVFQRLKDDNPRLVTVSKGYREPLCLEVR